MEHYDSVITAREIIKQKYNELRRGKLDISEKLEKHYKPVIDPLKELVKLQKGKALSSSNDKEKQESSKLPFLPKEIKVNTDEEEVEGKNENNKNETDSDVTDVQSSANPNELEDSYQLTGIPSPLDSYINGMKRDIKPYDLRYGIRKDKNTNKWMIGNQLISLGERDILLVDTQKFYLTPGLIELLFQKSPLGYSTDDLENYKRILELTNAHKIDYNPTNKVYRGNSIKYNSIIKKLYPANTYKQKKQKRGAGIFIPHSEKTYIYWDDPNELVNRLALLSASKQAGHTGHDREILSIEEELREAGYIK